jgi:hypothetical protein
MVILSLPWRWHKKKENPAASDLFNDTHPSVTILPLTSSIFDAPSDSAHG